MRPSVVQLGMFGLTALVASSAPSLARPADVLRDAMPSYVAPAPHGPDAWSHVLEFAGPRHLGAIRARFGATTSGVPIRYRWESLDCETRAFAPLAEASEEQPDAQGLYVLPRRKTWFVDARSCGLRLSVTGTNGGPPVVEQVEAIEGARDVLRSAAVTGPGVDPAGAVDGTYERAFTGEPGKGAWTLDVRLPRPERIDRVRLVLGADATTLARPRLGRTYAVARAPSRWTLSGSADGQTFVVLARSSSSLVRRPMVRVTAREVIALRLTLEGATDDAGRPSAQASPVVRELSAYSADDRAPILAEPWVLSVNANPVESAHQGPGGELANDAYFAKFLQKRFSHLSQAMARDDRYARRLGGHGELLETTPTASDGRALEAIEGDDPTLDPAWLAASWPPPIVVLSGSNDWDYARRTTVSAKGRTRWNPLLPAREGGMGDLALAVKSRSAPFLGFCGGAQILALLEARSAGQGDEIDAVLRRNTGRPIRGFASNASLIRAWPGEGRPAPSVTFDPSDPLFADLSGPSRRTTTHAFPQSHLDLIRPEAFAQGGPLSGLRILATSLFCSPAVSAALHPLAIAPNPNGSGRCTRVTEVFRSVGGRWPIVGAQFHAEQRDFDVAPAGDPAESVSDARMFVAAAYEAIIDAYLATADL